MHRNSFRLLILGCSAIYCLISAPAFAHLGHLGEFAGHSHVAGALLGGLAAGLAGILTAHSKRSKDSDMKKADSDISGDNVENPEIGFGADQNA
jgi:hypothetical protein